MAFYLYIWNCTFTSQRFFLTDIEIGVNSIVGLIIQNQLDENGKIILDINGQPLRQWMINFGGDAITNYQSGIQIPFYVIAFGLIGGYLRYLIKTFRKGGAGILHQKELFDERKEILKQEAELRKELEKAKGRSISDKELKEYSHSLQKTQFVRETLSELAELLLSPMLAIVAYFLLYQGAAPNIYTTAIVSFTVGLITKDFVDRLENIVREKVQSPPTCPPGQHYDPALGRCVDDGTPTQPQPQTQPQTQTPIFPGTGRGAPLQFM